MLPLETFNNLFNTSSILGEIHKSSFFIKEEKFVQCFDCGLEDATGEGIVWHIPGHTKLSAGWTMGEIVQTKEQSLALAVFAVGIC
jgi:hypothetical protein